tara:strand:- start:2031 stop:2228 length:198 start_codon:yes stop_codon:yes gene_type:complete
MSEIKFNYKVISDVDLPRLAEKVNYYLNEGYITCGGISSIMQEHGSIRFYQAICKDESNDRNSRG